MLNIKKSSSISLLISLLIVFLPLLSAQEDQKEKQEVTEEFFYAEEEVEIASLKPQPVEEAPGIVSVITSQQIKDMGARDLNDVLRMIPGFQLPIVPAYFVTTYGVRGLQQSYNNRVLVMMDGVPLNEAYYGQSNLTWSTMSINNIKRIEVIRGPGSALYGTYAFLAVINIISNKAEDINLFELKSDPYHPEKSRYVHINCRKQGKPPTVVPARFLVACENGHLDDFPWIQFVHRGKPCNSPILRLYEQGVSGSAADIWVKCDNCSVKPRPMSDAFGERGKVFMPQCTGRRPHLRDYEENCQEQMEAILLGASNSWFPISLSTLSIPTASGKLNRLIDENWHVLDKATSLEILKAFRQIGHLRSFTEYSDEEIWSAVESKRASLASEADQNTFIDLKIPEWEIFSNPSPDKNTADFYLTPVTPPGRYSKIISRVLQVDRLREVRALLGFSRIESPGDYFNIENFPVERRVPLSRSDPKWVPASEVRGEGLFIQFREEAISSWCKKPEMIHRENEFFLTHKNWRNVRGLTPSEAGFPGIRYVLIHSFAHALMRQLALECGYTAASIRERIYSQEPDSENQAMADVLIYTAAPDSEGTLGGLVSLGKPQELERLMVNAMEKMRLCASDPLCAEHHPPSDGIDLHGAACHACLFASETSCERGNKYLDRTVLVRTFGQTYSGFFDDEDFQP